MKIHIVQSGDSLSDLAKKYQLSEDRIIEANPNMDKDQQLKQGSKIFIPTGKIPLTKEGEKKDRPRDYEEDRNNEPIEQRESFSSIESSFRKEKFSYPPMQPEAYLSENAPFPSVMPSYPPMPPAFWDYSYHMVPPNPCYNMGQLSAVPMVPYYYDPYAYIPYDRDYEDRDHEFQLSYESSSYYSESNAESKWNQYWSEKESSSVEG